jgi:hypothetical protein
MSFYDMFFTVNPNASYIAHMIGLTEAEDAIHPTTNLPTKRIKVNIDRIRNIYTVDGKIMVYARIGGGNREHHEDNIKLMQNNPYYLYDEDCTADSTYAKFFFRYPTGAEVLEKLKEAAAISGREVDSADTAKITDDHITRLLNASDGPDPSDAWRDVFEQIKNTNVENIVDADQDGATT